MSVDSAFEVLPADPADGRVADDVLLELARHIVAAELARAAVTEQAFADVSAQRNADYPGSERGFGFSNALYRRIKELSGVSRDYQIPLAAHSYDFARLLVEQSDRLTKTDTDNRIMRKLIGDVTPELPISGPLVERVRAFKAHYSQIIQAYEARIEAAAVAACWDCHVAREHSEYGYRAVRNPATRRWEHPQVELPRLGDIPPGRWVGGTCTAGHIWDILSPREGESEE